MNSAAKTHINDFAILIIGFDHVTRIRFAPSPLRMGFSVMTGRPFTKDYLAKQVRHVLRKAGIPDEVQLRDIRRTASKERAEAGATEVELAAGTGHSIERGSQILDVYNPRSFTLAKAAQDKRRRHREEPKGERKFEKWRARQDSNL